MQYNAGGTLLRLGEPHYGAGVLATSQLTLWKSSAATLWRPYTRAALKQTRDGSIRGGSRRNGQCRYAPERGNGPDSRVERLVVPELGEVEADRCCVRPASVLHLSHQPLHTSICRSNVFGAGERLNGQARFLRRG